MWKRIAAVCALSLWQFYCSGLAVTCADDRTESRVESTIVRDKFGIEFPRSRGDSVQQLVRIHHSDRGQHRRVRSGVSAAVRFTVKRCRGC